jgi:subtilisin family serine protease
MLRRALFLLVLFAGPAFAESSKLDAHARIALAQARAAKGALPQLTAANVALRANGDLDAFVVGTATRAELERAGAIVRTQAGEVFTAWIPPAAVDRVAALAGVRRIEGATRFAPLLDKSVPSTGLTRGPGPDFLGVNGLGVLVGVVDEGVDTDHDDFRNAGGSTRFVALWDQTDGAGPAPDGFNYGAEWGAGAIRAGTTRQVDLTGHGTHCLGIAAGDGSATGGGVPAFTYAGMAPLASLAAVKTDLTGTGILDGASWFFRKAAALGKNAVLSISLGSHYGPHDGTSPIEAGLSALSGPGRVICVAAGNDRVTATHGRFSAGAGTSAISYINGVQSGTTVVYTGYYDSTEQMTLLVRGPNCFSHCEYWEIPPGTVNAPYPGAITASGRLYVENGVTTYEGTREVYIEVQHLDAAHNAQGSWTFRARPLQLGATNGRVDLWRIYSSALSAYFYAGRVDSMLVAEPANADEVISVGAWATKVDWTDCQGLPNRFYPVLGEVGQLASFSSRGPTRDGRPKPDLVAPGCEIAAATSFDWNPVCSPATAFLLPDGLQHIVNQGTSMAAPHVAGAVALLMQVYGAIDPAFAKGWLAAHALADSATGAVPNLDWGAGKLGVAGLHTVDVPPAAALATTLALAPLRPNPSTGGTLRLEFTLPRAGAARIDLVDVRGRVVRPLLRATLPAGPHAFAPDAGTLAPGLYFVVLHAGDARATRRLIVTTR